MEKKNNEMAIQMADFLLKISGADVVAPAELKDRIVKRFITEGPGKKVQKEFESITEVLSTMSPKEQEAIITALAFTMLKPSAFEHISTLSVDMIKEHLDYMGEHPEYRQMPEKEDLKDLMGI